MAVLLVALLAAPSFAHAIFPFAQNPSGTRSTPYPAGTVQSLVMNVPEERGGNPTSTVDIKVEFPAGWTKPACQGALTVSGTVPGPPADGWSCAVEPGSPTLLHWSRAAGSTVSAAYFPFTATTGPAGVYAFKVSQTYSSGEVVYWGDPPAPDPNANPPVVCPHGQNDTGTVCLQPAPQRYVTGTASPAASPGDGYWEVAADGGTFNYGSAAFLGGLSASASSKKPIVGAAGSPTGKGYWLASTDGGVSAFGDAKFSGPPAGSLRLNSPVVGIAATSTGQGYWLVGADGGIFNYGDAVFAGSAGSLRLNRPIVGIAATPSGKGYWLVAADGGIFNYGDAVFAGSAGSLRLNRPVASIAGTLTGKGYWLVATDGGVFNFGDARFFGSAASIKLNRPMVGLVVAR
ncbi:MAG TPA: hypothetical protein VGK51_11875 [Actinomycetota bacterium]